MTKPNPNFRDFRIPVEVYQAQQQGRLVIFCGSGVSRHNAKLPMFYDLTLEALKYFKKWTYEKNQDGEYVWGPVDVTSEIEKAIRTCFENSNFDRALGLLEDELGTDEVRKKVYEILELDADSSDISYHEDLLKLSVDKGQSRGSGKIITTNFDRGLYLADKKLKTRLNFDEAPKLSIPKFSKWSSVVHLHGMLPNTANKDINIVLTSADFGRAYLTERWAARFITELFRNFTVLFIGYSVDDPILHYVTDALAADYQNDDGVRQAYAFVLKEELPKWAAKKIEPIIHETHSDLRTKIERWAADWYDGQDDPERIVVKYARFKPKKGEYSEEEAYLGGLLTNFITDKKSSLGRDVSKITENCRLKEIDEALENDKNARFFEELDPSPEFEWVYILDEMGAFERASVFQKNSPEDRLLSNAPAIYWKRYNYTILCNVSQALCRWLAGHIGNEKFLYWMIEKGGSVTPYFYSQLEREFKDTEFKDPRLKKIWEYFFSGVNFSDRETLRSLPDIRDFGRLPDPAGLGQLMSPHLVLEDFTFRESKTFDVKTKLDKYSYNDVSKAISAHPYHFTGLLTAGTHYLQYLLEFKKEVSSKNDSSLGFALPSIKPHPQNSQFNSIANCVELLRDLFEVEWVHDKKTAKAVFKLWCSFDEIIFQRLVLHVITTKKMYGAKTAISFLKKRKGALLWDVSASVEKWRLIEKYWPELDYTQKRSFEELIIKGPPILRSDEDDKDWEERRSYAIWKTLKILTRISNLTELGHAALRSLDRRFEGDRLFGTERDYFVYWSTMSGYSAGDNPYLAENISDTDWQDLYQLILSRIEESKRPVKDRALTDRERFDPGDISSLAEAIPPEKSALIVSQAINNQDAALKDYVSHILRTNRIVDRNSWQVIAPAILARMNSEYLSELLPNIMFFINRLLTDEDTLNKSQDYNSLIDVLKAAHALLVDHRESPTYKDGDVLENAISSTVGNYAENTLIITIRDSDRKSGLPEWSKYILEKLLQRTSMEYDLYASAIIASRLQPLYMLDKTWCQSNVLPLFDYQNSPDLARVAWEGFLWGPRVSPELAVELRESMYQAINDDAFKEKRTLFQLFALCCISYPDEFVTNESAHAAKRMGKFGWNSFLIMILDLLESGEDRKIYWESRVKVVLEVMLPTEKSFKNPDRTKILAKICIASGDFVSAFEMLKNRFAPLPEQDGYWKIKSILEYAKKHNVSKLKLKELLSILKHGWRRDD